MISMTNNSKEIKRSSYRTIKNNNATNQLTRINTKKKNQLIKKAPKKGKGALNLSRNPTPDKNELKKGPQDEYQVDQITAWASTQLGPAQMQLFDYLNYQYSKPSHSETDPVIHFTVEEYAKDSNLSLLDKHGKPARYPRNKLIKNLKALFGLDFAYQDSKTAIERMHPISYFKLKRRNKQGHSWVQVDFDTHFTELLSKRAYAIPMHSLLFKLDAKHSPVSYAVLRALLVNKRNNFGTPRADRMKVGTLFKHCQGALPTYNEVMKYNKGRVTELIIKPFFDILEPLKEAFDYYFDDGNGSLIKYDDDKHGEGISYADLITKEIVVDWKNYPNSEVKQWIEARKKHKANTKRSKTLKNK